jgi:glycosyltransferase involved in cell wall biosynthesis
MEATPSVDDAPVFAGGAFPPRSARTLRVVMVVANDVTRDSRVLREAAALAAAGHFVTVLGIMTARTNAPTLEVRHGFVIRRLPYRAHPPSWWIPPDFYRRIQNRAQRQYRIHRARINGGARRVNRRGRIFASRLRRVHYRASRSSRLVRARVNQHHRPALCASFLHLTVALRGHLSNISVRPPRMHRRLRRPTRLVLRAARTPLPAWPAKLRRFAARARKGALRATHLLGDRGSSWFREEIARLHAAAAIGRQHYARGRRQAGSGLVRAVSITATTIAAIPRALWHGVQAWTALAGLLAWGTTYLLANRASGGALEWLTGWQWRWQGWARYVAEQAPDADVWHGHDLTSLPAVVALKRQRGGIAVYDSHEIYLESGPHAQQPRWAKVRLEHVERDLAAQVDAVVTVNDSLAAILAERLERPAVNVLYNCPPRFENSARPSRLRLAIGLSDGVPLLLYHGSLSPHRGLEQLLAAIQLPALAQAHLAFLGFGQLANWLHAEARDSRYGNRVHVLDAVAPDELLDWLVGVDVAVAPIQASTLNHRYSSPNKVFEAIATGTPVAGSDFPEFRRVIADPRYGPLGALFDPSSPDDIAASVRSLLDLSPAERRALRRRCRAAAEHHWNWETQSASLVGLYEGFAAPGPVARLGHQVAVA